MICEECGTISAPIDEMMVDFASSWLDASETDLWGNCFWDIVNKEGEIYFFRVSEKHKWYGSYFLDESSDPVILGDGHIEAFRRILKIPRYAIGMGEEGHCDHGMVRTNKALDGPNTHPKTRQFITKQRDGSFYASFNFGDFYEEILATEQDAIGWMRDLIVSHAVQKCFGYSDHYPSNTFYGHPPLTIDVCMHFLAENRMQFNTELDDVKRVKLWHRSALEEFKENLGMTQGVVQADD